MPGYPHLNSPDKGTILFDKRKQYMKQQELYDKSAERTGRVLPENKSRPSQLKQIQKTPGTMIVRGVFNVTAVPANPYISDVRPPGLSAPP